MPNKTYRGAKQKSQMINLHDVSVGRSHAPSLLASLLSHVPAEDTKSNSNLSRTKKRPAPDDGYAVEFAHSTNNTLAFSRRKRPRTIRRERASPVNRTRGLRPGTHTGRRDVLHTASTLTMPDSLPDPWLPPVTSENTTHRVASHAAPVGAFTRTTQHGFGLPVTVPAANDLVLAYNEYPSKHGTPPQDDASRWVDPTSQRDQVATQDAGPLHQWIIPDPLYYTSTLQPQDAPAQTAPQVSVWSMEDVQHPTMSESVLHHDSEFTGHLWSTQHPALPSCEGSYTRPHVGQLLGADELAYVRADCTREFLARLAPLLVPFRNATDVEDAPIRPDKHTPMLPEDFWVTVARCISDSNWGAPGAIDLAIEACTRHLSSALEAWASSRVAMSDMTSRQQTYVPGLEMMTL